MQIVFLRELCQYYGCIYVNRLLEGKIGGKGIDRGRERDAKGERMKDRSGERIRERERDKEKGRQFKEKG